MQHWSQKRIKFAVVDRKNPSETFSVRLLLSIRLLTVRSSFRCVPTCLINVSLMCLVNRIDRGANEKASQREAFERFSHSKARRSPSGSNQPPQAVTMSFHLAQRTRLSQTKLLPRGVDLSKFKRTTSVHLTLKFQFIAAGLQSHLMLFNCQSLNREQKAFVVIAAVVDSRSQITIEWNPKGDGNVCAMTENRVMAFNGDALRA